MSIYTIINAIENNNFELFKSECSLLDSRVSALVIMNIIRFKRYDFIEHLFMINKHYIKSTKPFIDEAIINNDKKMIEILIPYYKPTTFCTTHAIEHGDLHMFRLFLSKGYPYDEEKVIRIATSHFSLFFNQFCKEFFPTSTYAIRYAVQLGCYELLKNIYNNNNINLKDYCSVDDAFSGTINYNCFKFVFEKIGKLPSKKSVALLRNDYNKYKVKNEKYDESVVLEMKKCLDLIDEYSSF